LGPGGAHGRRQCQKTIRFLNTLESSEKLSEFHAEGTLKAFADDAIGVTENNNKCAVDYDTTALSAIRDVGSLWWRPLTIYV